MATMGKPLSIASTLRFAPDRATAKKFASKVALDGGCWVWTGALRRGYGVLRIGSSMPKQEMYQHAYVRTDVLQCTLLANIDDKLDRIGRMFAGAINESGLNPNKPIITKLH